MNSFCGGTDNVDDQVEVGQHRDVAAINRVGGCTHALCQEALQIRFNVRSLLATMYQLGFDFQAVPAAFRLKMSAAGA